MLRPLHQPRSLRAVLVLFALSIIVPAMLAVTVLVGWNTVRSRDARAAELLANARAVSAAVDLRMSALTAAAGAVATSDPLLRGDYPGTRERFARLDLGDRVWLSVVDRSGRRLLLSAPTSVAGDVAGALAADGRPLISGIIAEGAAGVPVVAISQAVPGDAAGRVVTLAVAAEALRDLLQAERRAPVAFVTLVDGRARVVARTAGHARFVGKTATPHMRRAMAERPEGVVTSRSLDGQPTVVAYVASPRTGWTTMVVAPRRDFTGPIARSAAATAAVAGLMLLLAVLGARLFGRLISKELQALEGDAATLGEGGAVAPREGPIIAVNTVQRTLSAAAAELRVRGERQQLMIHELNHRVKNTLATVQSLAWQTFRGGDAEARAKFDQRLAALAAAHDLLTATNWEAVDIREVVARCGEPVGAGMQASGPSLLLPPQAALALCMCLHELCTNSLKYGALSAEGGEVAVRWSRDEGDDALVLIWRETGGPPPSPPRRRGFGSQLMDRMAATELGGRFDRHFAPTGLVATGRFHIPRAERWRTDFHG